MNRDLLSRLALCGSVALLAGCGGGTSASTLPSSGFTPLPVLVAGSTYDYAGTYSEVTTYASPTPPTRVNSSGSYTVADVETVESAASGAPAPFDVHRVLTYSVTKAPVSGIELAQRTSDSFQSSTVTSTSQTIAEAAVTTKVVGVNMTAGRVAGNGPYAYTDTTQTTYPSPLILQVFPLQAGAKRTQTLARNVTSNGQSINAAKDVYSSHNLTTTYANDGSYTQTGSIGPGETTNVVASANGTATTTNSGKTTLTQTIGIPALVAGAYSIPVSRTVNGTSNTYDAADWYPGNALPPSPLALSVQTVKGPSSLPASCHVGVPTTNLEEVDTTSATLDVTGTYDTTTAQTFLSNGVTVCRANVSTDTSYDIETGALVSTTVDTFAEGLSSQTAAARLRKP